MQLDNTVKAAATIATASGIAGSILSTSRTLASDGVKVYVPGKYELPPSWRAFPPSVSGTLPFFTYH
jgi:hypothetical protein